MTNRNVMKHCRSCGEHKPLDEFGHNWGGSPKPVCHSCVYLAHVRNKYGLSESQYNHIKDASGGKCILCQCDDKRLVVDHCHTTGMVRGLICSRCNTGLGMFKDDNVLLGRAMQYLSAQHIKPEYEPAKSAGTFCR